MFSPSPPFLASCKLYIQTGTLDLLISLSEELPKLDSFFTSAVAKIVDTLRNLLNNDPSRLAQHTLVDEKTCDDYLLRDWRWNSGKYNTGRSLRDIVDGLVKVRNSCRCLDRIVTLSTCVGNVLARQCHEDQTEQLQSCQGCPYSDAAQEDVSAPCATTHSLITPVGEISPYEHSQIS